MTVNKKLVEEALRRIREAEKLLEQALRGDNTTTRVAAPVPLPAPMPAPPQPVRRGAGEEKEAEEKKGEEKKGFLQRLAERMILSDLPALRKKTSQALPESLLRYYFTLFHRREYTPLEEAKIRNKLVVLKEDSPEQYKQLEQLLQSPPPWNILAIAVLDNMANKRGMPISLSKLVSEYNAVQVRDPYYFVARLREKGYEKEASMYWTLWYHDRETAERILETFYSIITPEPTEYTGIPSIAVDQAVKAVREAYKQIMQRKTSGNNALPRP